MSDNREENIRINQMPEELPPWMQTADSVDDQKKFHEFLIYLRNDATECLPANGSNILNTEEYNRPSIPIPKGIIVKSDCGYSYYHAENQCPKISESIKEPYQAPTLFESIMSYFRLAVKV